MEQQRWLLVSDENFIRFIQRALSEVNASVKFNKIHKFLSLSVSASSTYDATKFTYLNLIRNRGCKSTSTSTTYMDGENF
jgi:hypothetical protein